MTYAETVPTVVKSSSSHAKRTIVDQGGGGQASLILFNYLSNALVIFRETLADHTVKIDTLKNISNFLKKCLIFGGGLKIRVNWKNQSAFLHFTLYCLIMQ